MGAVVTTRYRHAVALYELCEVLLPARTKGAVLLLGQTHGGQVRRVHMAASNSGARRPSSASGEPGSQSVARGRTSFLDKLLDGIRPRVQPDVESLCRLGRRSGPYYLSMFENVNSLGSRTANRIRKRWSTLPTTRRKFQGLVRHRSSISGGSTVKRERCGQCYQHLITRNGSRSVV